MGRTASSSSGVLVAAPAPNSTTAPPRATMAGDVEHHLLEQGGLGAGRVIGRQPGDLVEQFGPAPVVQPARGDRRDRLGEAGQHIGAEGGIDRDFGFKRLEQGGLR